MKDGQRMQYKSSHQLVPIAAGRSIRMKLPHKDSWMLGECKKNSQTFIFGACEWAIVLTCVTRCQRVSSLPERETPMSLPSREAWATMPPENAYAGNIPEVVSRFLPPGCVFFFSVHA